MSETCGECAIKPKRSGDMKWWIDDRCLFGVLTIECADWKKYTACPSYLPKGEK